MQICNLSIFIKSRLTVLSLLQEVGRNHLQKALHSLQYENQTNGQFYSQLVILYAQQSLRIYKEDFQREFFLNKILGRISFSQLKFLQKTIIYFLYTWNIRTCFTFSNENFKITSIFKVFEICIRYICWLLTIDN